MQGVLTLRGLVAAKVMVLGLAMLLDAAQGLVDRRGLDAALIDVAAVVHVARVHRVLCEQL